MSLASSRLAIGETHRLAEDEAVGRLLDVNDLDAAQRENIMHDARDIVQGCRARHGERSLLDLFLREFGLSNEEGIALLCLAEALLRIPDDATADELIADKVGSGKWSDHWGQSESLFVNASTWALMLTGNMLKLDAEITSDAIGWMRGLVARLGESVARTAMVSAIKILAQEFVLGRTIEEALDRSDGLASFDMLGEGARSMESAERYFDAYAHALRRVIAASSGTSPVDSSGISVKLSALHPRFEPLKREVLLRQLLPRIEALAQIAADGNINLTIDAEEADRIELTLDVFARLARSKKLQGWTGLGIAVQAYAKRAPAIIRWLDDLADETGMRFMVRLVKGAYWDTEIKRAQVAGLAGYPVYTRKANTDLAYLVCAQALFRHQPRLYPQFATHNAHTIAAIRTIADQRPYELQRLHGMGELLYDEARSRFDDLASVRVYAPVGSHRDLLAYLVRRLLENGANSSFVNRFLDDQVAAEQVVKDPITDVTSRHRASHPDIPLPQDLFRTRPNSQGIDLGDPTAVTAISAALRRWSAKHWGDAPGEPVVNPADPSEIVGWTHPTDDAGLDAAVSSACLAHESWHAAGVEARAEVIERLADALVDHRHELLSLLQREAGKTLTDAVTELREAEDFCRYYAVESRRLLDPITLTGPTGETNQLSLHGRGVFACISPWNFPASIFLGQIAAALVAGNCVVAKPAEQTPLIARRIVELAYGAGIGHDVLRLIVGGAALGDRLVGDARISGVVFTGSTETARAIARRLASREGPIVPLIAETGGQNAMVVDSSALIEQVVDDVIASAFGNAGQRCSALRVLYVQEEIADGLIRAISGAMDTLVAGDQRNLDTDIGPVIDQDAQSRLARYVDTQDVSHRTATALGAGTFLAPTLIELATAAKLDEEHFGPILHVVRYGADDIERVIDEINELGYGLTFGVHSRIDSTIAKLVRGVKVGNTYVNRATTGAVVGVQPFGGEGLSGTGPKAGGPHYLLGFVVERAYSRNTVATGGNPALLSLPP